MLKVKFNSREIENGEKLTMQETSSKPDISWDTKSNKLYTVIIYDLDAPYPDRGSIYLHMLMINLPEEGDIVADYMGPSPPKDSPKHRYIVRVYKQEDRLRLPDIRERQDFDLEDFVRANDLKNVDHLLFYVKYDKKVRKKDNSEEYFVEESLLSESQGTYDSHGESHSSKYCRCVLHVAAKNPEWCNREKAWFDVRDGDTCYNPYAVCAKTTRTSYRHCFGEYDLHEIPYTELKALAELKNIENISSDKDNLIEQLRDIKIRS